MAAAVGVYLAFVGGWPVVVIAIVSIICAVAYTGGPMPLAYVGLGDLFVLVFFGPVAVSGTVFVQTLTWRIEAVAAGTALGLLATAILVVNNLRDRHTDAVAGKRTLAVRFGATAVRVEYTLAVLVAYGICMAWWLDGAGAGWLLPLLSIPLAGVRIRDVWKLDGANLNPQLGATARLLLLFSALLALGLGLGMAP
jgi:1,4-dihydroxy-2-naphthoate octaprenyltransferase